MENNIYSGVLTHSGEVVTGNLITTRNGNKYIIPSDVIETDGHHIRIYSDVPYRVDNATVELYPNTFIRSWKCTKTNPPIESGRYWCLVKEQNDLGLSYYQWNCTYIIGMGFSLPHGNDIEITHWTELLPRPSQSNTTIKKHDDNDVTDLSAMIFENFSIDEIETMIKIRQYRAVRKLELPMKEQKYVNGLFKKIEDMFDL